MTKGVQSEWHRSSGSLRQRGAALIIGAVLLVVLSVLVLANMRGAGIQETVSSNFETRSEARELAEAALRAGERDIRQGDAVSRPCFGSSFGSKVADASGGSATLIGPTCAHDLPNPPGFSSARAGNARYVIERLPTTQNPSEDNLASDEVKDLRSMYRVTAEGTVGNALVILQSFYFF
ncbi:MAG: PilX N-terminal domain-containing pilus assembly protein [Thioalkalivibrionaceae bacterium]